MLPFRKTLAGSAVKAVKRGSNYYERMDGKMENKKTGKVKTGFWIDRDVMDGIDELLEKADAKSRSEFVQRAIEFYSAFLQTKKVEKYLLPTISATITNQIGSFEERVARHLYREAVITCVMCFVLSSQYDLSEEEIESVYEEAEKYVQTMAGYWEK